MSLCEIGIPDKSTLHLATATSYWSGLFKSGIIVEDGEPASLFENPVHEYTKMLVSAVPGKSAELAKGTR